MVKVTAENRANNTCKVGTLYLVDLAGSEELDTARGAK